MSLTQAKPWLFSCIAPGRKAPSWQPLLADRPTPLQAAPELGEHFGIPTLYLKRDERSAPDYGGGKPRKLEFLLAAALARQATGVETVGPVGSHHVLATAVHARRLGLSCTAWLFPRPASPQVSENLAATLAAGANLHFLPHPALLPLVRARAATRTADQRRDSYWIAAGGSHSVGLLGFVEGALELVAQCKAAGLPHPGWVVVALGSGGLAVGLAAGLALCGSDTRVLAVRVVPRIIANRWWLLRPMADLQRQLRALGFRLPSATTLCERILIIHQQAGRGYGHPTAAAERACILASKHAGLGLDLTYTAKALAGLEQLKDSGAARLHRPVVFWQTHNGHPLQAIHAGSDGLPSLPRALQRWLQDPDCDLQGELR